MRTRILIQLAEPAAAGGLPAEVQQVLERAGATVIRASHPELPGLFTASLPENVDVNALLQELKHVPGVRHAEPDQSRGTL